MFRLVFKKIWSGFHLLLLFPILLLFFLFSFSHASSSPTFLCSLCFFPFFLPLFFPLLPLFSFWVAYCCLFFAIDIENSPSSLMNFYFFNIVEISSWFLFLIFVFVFLHCVIRFFFFHVSCSDSTCACFCCFVFDVCFASAWSKLYHF